MKPNTGDRSPPSAPYERNDDFSGPKLKNVWQWNHVPDDTKWSLTERPGFLRLAFIAGPGFLVGAQHAHAARHRPRVDSYGGAGYERHEGGRCRRSGAPEFAVCVDRCKPSRPRE